MKKLTKDFMRYFIAIILCLVSVISGQLSLSAFPVYAAETQTSFEKTNVLDDLESSDGFDILNYPFDSTGLIKHPKIMNVVEYCYSFRQNATQNYGLYLYFYNPQALSIEQESPVNKVELAVSYRQNEKGELVPDSYEKFDLQFCSMSQGDYYGLFYKYKVIDHKSADGLKIVERVNSNARRYDISGIELLTKGDGNATDYTIGGTYIFTGYAKGYGADINAESNLDCEVRKLETVRLDLSGKDDGIDKRTYWRSNSSSFGAHHQNQINSVFFAIDKNVLKEYGDTLQKIKAEWWEYKTVPAIVIDNKSIYDRLAKYSGVQISEDYDEKRGFTLFNFDFKYAGSGTGSASTYQYSWNAQLSSAGLAGEYAYFSEYVDTLLPLLFYTNGIKVGNYTLSAETLQNQIDNYDKSYIKGHLQFNAKDFSADVFADNVDEGRTRGYNLREFDIGNPDDYWNIRSYDDTHSWWNKLCSYGFGKMTTDDTYLDILPIQMISDSDMAVEDLATHLKINPNDVSNFRKYYDSVKKDYEVFIFRYAVTDYWAEDLLVHDIVNNEKYPYDTIGKHNSVIGEVRQGTQFYDFDIIEFTFNNEGVYTVIPVVSSPVDHVSGYSPAVKPETYDWLKILQLIFEVLALILLVVIIAPILPPVISLLIKIVLLPFKAIAALFKAIFHKKE